MTTLAQDNFDSDTAGAIAPGWAALLGSPVVGTTRPVSSLNSFGFPTDGSRALYTALAARADMEISTDFIYVPSSGGGSALCHVLRSSADGVNNYELLLFTNAANCNVVVRSNVGSTQANLGVVSNALTGVQSGDTIHMDSSIVGSTVNLYVWTNNNAKPTTPTFTGASTAVTAAGYPGLVNIFYQGNTPVYADNFVYTDAGAAAVKPGVPTIGTATAGATQATITFTPADANATSFTATWSGGGTVTGASSPLTLTGLTAGTAGTFHVTASNSAGTSNPSAESTSVTPSAAASQLTAVQFSPYNWSVTAAHAVAVNPGAWLRTFFSGTACTLNFDNVNTASSVPPILFYRIDRGPIKTVALTTATLSLDMSTADASAPTYGGHYLEVWFGAFDTSAGNRWGPTPGAAISLVSITAGTLTLPPIISPRNILVLGDSITEGVSSISSTYGQNSMLSYAGLMGDLVGANVGVVGFAGQAWTAGGQFSVPAFGSTWNYIYSGVARIFTPTPDVIVINMGQNDGGADVSSAAVPVLTAMLAATPSTTKIIVLSPFSQNSASSLQAAVNTVNNARLTYVSTSGFKVTGQIHPWFTESLQRLGPAVANVVRPVLNGTVTPTLTARTVSLTLRNSTGALAASLTGVKISWHDEPTPDLHTIARYNTASGTTNASGVMSFTVQSTLASGGSGSVTAQDSAGNNLFATIAVA